MDHLTITYDSDSNEYIVWFSAQFGPRELERFDSNDQAQAFVKEQWASADNQ